MTDMELALVIEDDEDLATIFSEALQAAHFTVETIRDGKQAQIRLFAVQPQVIILDMHLPNVDGMVLLRLIRADPRLKDTIIVVATADARMGELYVDEADFVLIKPISFTQLRDLTERLHKG
ncbi:MAG: response regulator [Anaerolineales bacterium]|nr:response regulator [Anaerolineales bacterium]